MHEGLPLPLCLLVGRQASAKGTTLKFSSDEQLIYFLFSKKNFFCILLQRKQVFMLVLIPLVKSIYFISCSQKKCILLQRKQVYMLVLIHLVKSTYFISCSPKKTTFFCILLQRKQVFMLVLIHLVKSTVIFFLVLQKTRFVVFYCGESQYFMLNLIIIVCTSRKHSENIFYIICVGIMYAKVRKIITLVHS